MTVQDSGDTVAVTVETGVPIGIAGRHVVDTGGADFVAVRGDSALLL